MRTRSRAADQLSQTGTVFHVYGSSYVKAYDATVRCNPLVEEITDIGDAMKWSKCVGQRVFTMKPVTHAKASVTFNMAECRYLYSTSYAIAAPAAVWLTTHLGNTLVNDLLDPYIGSDPPNPQNSFGAMWEKGKPSMSSRASASVFLYELREIKRMFDIIPGRHTKYVSWYWLLKRVNEGHLSFNFGWRPFVADILRFSKQLADFETRLNRFITGQNKLLLRHVGNPETKDESAVWTSSGYDPHVQFEWKTTVTQKLCGTFQYSYSLPSYDFQSFRFRALADALGMKLDLAAVWAIVPWSFVVDYFYNLGNFLEQFGDDWIEPWITYCQGTHSIKHTSEVEVHVHLRKAVPSYYRTALAAKLTSSSYTRIIGWPSISPPDAGSLTLDKIRLLASLGVSLVI